MKKYKALQNKSPFPLTTHSIENESMLIQSNNQLITVQNVLNNNAKLINNTICIFKQTKSATPTAAFDYDYCHFVNEKKLIINSDMMITPRLTATIRRWSLPKPVVLLFVSLSRCYF